MRLFFDGLGKWVINDNAEHKVLPDHTRIIAVRGGVDGVLLLTSDGFSTANLTRWKCSDKYVDGWQEVSFNESGSDSGQWNTPHVLHKKRPVAFPPAQWINYTTSDKGEYFCRGKYGELKHKVLNQCWANVGSLSWTKGPTLAEH